MVVGEAVEFEVEQFAGSQAGAAQDSDGAACGDVVEFVDGGHQVAVGVGAQRSGTARREAWEVAAMDERSWWSFGPAPERDVFEERLQRRDGSVLAGDRHRLPVAAAALVMGRVWFQVRNSSMTRAVELIEPVDVGMVGREPHGEHLEGVASVLDRGRSQRCRARLEVALHEPTDLGLRDLGELVSEASSPDVRMLGWCCEEAELEAHLLQRSESGRRMTLRWFAVTDTDASNAVYDARTRRKSRSSSVQCWSSR